jgi:hypothetical protein
MGLLVSFRNYNCIVTRIFSAVNDYTTLAYPVFSLENVLVMERLLRFGLLLLIASSRVSKKLLE